MAKDKSISLWIFMGTFIVVVWVLRFGFTAKFDNASAQQAAPTESKGVTRTLLTAVDLGPEISGMQGRKLELRMVTIEPGGFAGVHSHKDLPGAAYLLKGTIIGTGVTWRRSITPGTACRRLGLTGLRTKGQARQY